MPLLVAAATRPPEGEGRDRALVAELIADPEVTPIRPEPLGRASIAALARELHGLRPDDAFSAALETATGGNPLLVVALNPGYALADLALGRIHWKRAEREPVNGQTSHRSHRRSSLPPRR